jgi:DNA-binding CsgD family transcriptional regulator
MVTSAQWQASKSLVAQATRPHPSHNVETMMTNLGRLIDVRCAAVHGWEQPPGEAPRIALRSFKIDNNPHGGVEIQPIQRRSVDRIDEIRTLYEPDLPDTKHRHADMVEAYQLLTSPQLMIGECRQPIPERRSIRGLLIFLHLGQKEPSTELHQLIESILPAIATVSHQYLKRNQRGHHGCKPPLTNRESEVLSLFASGSGVQGTSKALNVSPRTVRFHLHNIYRKLGVHSQREAIVHTQRMNLIAD